MWEYGYDAAQQLTRGVKKSTDPTPSILKRYSYAYDTAGNRTIEQIDDAVMGASSNNLNRSTSQHPSGVIRVAGTVNEAAVVSIQSKPASMSSANVFEGTATIPSGTSTFTVSATDTNNNVTSKTYEIENTGSNKTFTYDANGNMTSDGTRTFEWDARNQLVAVEVGTHRSEFTYDAVQRRVRIIEKENGITQNDKRVIWNKMKISEERAADGATVTRRVFGLGEQVSTSDQFLASDHLGSVRHVTDTSSGVLAHYAFDPWGWRELIAGTSATNVGFTDLEERPTTDVLLAAYRGYDANLARWLTEDPLGLAPEPNRYAYVSNRPIVWRDPLGLAPWHGNYCGPGANGGDPVGDIDAACQKHDSCYDDAGVSGFGGYMSGWGSKACRLNECDAELCRNVTNAKLQSYDEALAASVVTTIFCYRNRRPPVPQPAYQSFF